MPNTRNIILLPHPVTALILSSLKKKICIETMVIILLFSQKCIVSHTNRNTITVNNFIENKEFLTNFPELVSFGRNEIAPPKTLKHWYYAVFLGMIPYAMVIIFGSMICVIQWYLDVDGTHFYKYHEASRKEKYVCCKFC